MNPLKIGNASGFWGDDTTAAARLLKQAKDLDYLTLDFLAEVSLSIMAIQREKDPQAGYAKDFISCLKTLLPFWENGASVKIVTNAGGLDPLACGQACREEIKKAGLKLKVAVITGDNVLENLQEDPLNPLFDNLDTGNSLSTISEKLVTANAYIGARQVAEALEAGADIVIGGRIADPSLTVGPCLYHFKWSDNEYDKIAGATVAGHLIECGTQVTGGISSDWLNLPQLFNIGFPIAEIDEKGGAIITKPKQTGGAVTERTVKEQLLYELGDPANYLSPDAKVSFLSLNVRDLGDDRVVVENAKGSPPTNFYKVSATYRQGFKAEAFLAIFGKDAPKKAQKAGEAVFEKLKQSGFDLRHQKIECLGAGDLVPGIVKQETKECVLRLAARDERCEALEQFSKEIAPLVTSGPQGITGYSSGRPKVRAVFGFWPCLIEKKDLKLKIEVL